MIFFLALLAIAIEAVHTSALDAGAWSWGQRITFVLTAWVLLHVLYWLLHRIADRILYSRHGAFYGSQKYLASLGDEFGGRDGMEGMKAQDPAIGAVKLVHFIVSWPLAIGCALWVAL